jgi:hypothetical protein
MKRNSRLPLVLALAFLASIFAPLRMGWACPDGTPCVANHSEHFECASNVCASAKSCCEREHPVACKHGAFPAPSSDHRTSVQTPDHCRFNISTPPHLAAVVSSSSLHAPVADALPVRINLELPQPVIVPAWRSEYTLGYRPPPLERTGPTRAPPTL